MAGTKQVLIGPMLVARVVSSVVSFVQRASYHETTRHDTDAQNTASMLRFVVSGAVPCLHGVQGVAGSNPAVPIYVRQSREAS